MNPVNPHFINDDGARRVLRALIEEIMRVDNTTATLSAVAGTQTLTGSGGKISVFNAASGSGMYVSHADDRITAVYPGRYLIWAQATLRAASGSSGMAIVIKRNGTEDLGSGFLTVGTTDVTIAAMTESVLEEGDYIEMYETGGQNVLYTFSRMKLLVRRVG